MIKKIGFIILGMTIVGLFWFSQIPVQAMTRSELTESLTLTVEAGLTAEEYYQLGQQYESGNGVVQWYAKAKVYYGVAANLGLEEANQALDNLAALKTQTLASGDQGEVFQFYRKGVTASQAGNYEQAFAIYYDDSFFFEDPSDRGLGGLADLYLAGNGVVQDVTKAIAIYEVMAKEQGKGNGYTALGNIYAAKTGSYPGITQSLDTALQYYLLSFQGEGLKSTDFKGPRYAANFYDAGFYHDDGTWEAPNYALAESYYLIAVAGNGRTFDGTSAYKLGTYYEMGRQGVAQDYEKAVTYYEKAVSDPNVHSTMLGIPDTYLSLGRFYEEGLGVAANKEQAITYYKLAQSAAQDNINLGGNVAGYAAAQKVYQQATSTLERLTTATDDNQQTTTDDTPTSDTNDDKGNNTSSQKIVTLSDTATGVSVTGTQEVLSNAVAVVVRKTTVASLKDLNYDAYNITLQDADGNQVQPNGDVQVTLPATGEVSALYHVAGDATFTSFVTTQTGNEVQFKTNHFSVYAVVYKEQVTATATTSDGTDSTQSEEVSTNTKQTVLPQTGEKTLPLTLYGVLLGAVAVLLALHQAMKTYISR